MSVDFYLFKIGVDQNADEARVRLDLLNDRIASGSGPPDHHLPVVKALIAHEPRFAVSEYYFCDVFPGDKTTEIDRQRFKYFELNGPPELGMTQIVLHANHIVLHCYSGTSEDELENYFRVVCEQTEYAVFDPQSGQIYRYADP